MAETREVQLAYALRENVQLSHEGMNFDLRVSITTQALRKFSNYLSNFEASVVNVPHSDLHQQLDEDSEDVITRDRYCYHALATAEWLSIQQYVSKKYNFNRDQTLNFARAFVTEHYTANMENYLLRGKLTSNYLQNTNRKFWESVPNFLPYFYKIGCNGDINIEGKGLVQTHIKNGISKVNIILDDAMNKILAL